MSNNKDEKEIKEIKNKEVKKDGFLKNLIKKIPLKVKFIIILIFALLIAGLIINAKYIDRAENGLDYRTYVHINEDGEKYKIKIDEENVYFIEMDFLDIYETMSTIKLAKEVGLNFNTYTQEQKEELIKNNRDLMVKANVFKLNTPYKYTYFKDTGLISIKSGEYEISLSFSDTPIIKFLPFLKQSGITLYNELYE